MNSLRAYYRRMNLFILITMPLFTSLSSIANTGLEFYYIRHAEGGHIKKAWEEKWDSSIRVAFIRE